MTTAWQTAGLTAGGGVLESAYFDESPGTRAYYRKQG